MPFVEDVAASGGYWLACAADKIWADRTSILGSIGVISAGFGFHEAISADRRGAACLHGRRVEIDPRPVPPGKGRGRGEGSRRFRASCTKPSSSTLKTSRGRTACRSPRAFHRRLLDGIEIRRTGPCRRGSAIFVPKMKELYGDKTPFFRRVRARAAACWGGFGISLASELATRVRGTRGLREVRPVVMLKIVTLFPDLHGRARHVRAPAPAQDHPAPWAAQARDCARPAGATTFAAAPARIVPTGRADAWRQRSLWRGSASSSCFSRATCW